MIFNSITYLVLLAVVFALYWLLPLRPRLVVIFAASLTFYGFWRVEFLPVMLFSTVLDYVAALSIHRSARPAVRRAWLLVSMMGNLGLLFFFKYLGFCTENVNSLFHLIGLDAQIPFLSVILPLGISFYTFQTMSYTIDVYRGFIKPERDFILYGSYVTFFPQLVAGPILRAGEVVPQLAERATFNPTDVALGIRRILYGLFLKVMLADNVAPIVEGGFLTPTSSLSGFDVWTLAFLFGFQIYFDFAGYSHIALGSARIMGIRFPENFDFPYMACSPRDFWRRWHISLSSWIRDYLYLPLAGQRVHDHSSGGLAVAAGAQEDSRRTRALFLSWAIMGLWHGAAWTFVVWGLYHATTVYAYRLIQPWSARLPLSVRTLGGWSVTLLVAMLGWIPFRAQGLAMTGAMFAKVVNPAAYTHLALRENVYLVALLLLVGMILCYRVRLHVAPWLDRRPALAVIVETPVFAAIVLLVFVFLRPISQFIYFQF